MFLRQILASRCLLILALLLLPLSIFAQAGKFTLSVNELKLSGPYDQPLSCTFSVMAKSLPELTPLTHDLIGTKTGTRLVSTKITVTSPDEAIANRKKFTVLIEAATQPDLYAGELELYEKDAATPAAKIKLQVEFKPTPNVDAESKDKSLVIAVQQAWDDLPYVGSDTARAAFQTERINLIQTAEGEATVDMARIYSLRGNDGLTLPENAVRILSPIPLPVNTQPVRIGVAALNLPAGEYNGMVYLKVRDQKQAVQIPLTVKIKHGPMLAVLALVLGFLAVALFGWWKDEGQGKRDLVQPLQKLAQSIRVGGKLQANERDEAFRLVKTAMQALEAGEPYVEAKQKFDAAQTYIDTARAEADKLLAEVLAPLLQTTRELVPGKTLREGFIKSLETLKQSVLKGEYQQLSEARQLLEDKTSGLIAKIDYFREFVEKFAEIADDKKEEAARAFDEAGTSTDLRDILQKYGVTLPPLKRGISFDTHEGVPSGSAESDGLELSLKRRLQLKGGGVVVMLLAYAFVLVIGFITLYVKSATFGADPMDYVYLFLWGSTIETVRGKTIDLTSLQTLTPARAAAGGGGA